VAVRQILLDTNAYAAFKRDLPEAVELIRRAPLIGINTIVLGELLAGFAVGTRESANKQELNIFLASRRVKLFHLDDNTAELYATVYRDLKRRGRPIPTNDMWIAATALQHGLAVFTFDGHFQYVDGIVVGAAPSDFMY
jgi:tRNA(fMet)-specific endonuclease VapC